MSERSDRELVHLAHRGEKTAIGELFSRYWRAARAAAFGVTGEFASAEDAAAEAFQQALAGMDSLRDPDRFGSWLRTIVVRKARLGLQSGCLTIDALAGDLSDESERPDEALARLELGALVRHGIRELPDALREAMALVYFEGYDARVAARFLDIPPGALRRRLHDGRARLRITVERMLRGRKQMNEERERKIRRLRTMIDSGEVYQGLRGSLALRPPPRELIEMFLRRQTALTNEAQAAAAGRDDPTELICRTIEQLSRPSDRATDPGHPVGAIAAAIRTALPDFQDWRFNAGEAAVHFWAAATGPHGDRLGTILPPGLPPGFAQGRPGAFLRRTRAILFVKQRAGAQTLYEHLQDSSDEQTFRAAKDEMRLSDVLDLSWMTAGPVELRSVQALLERLTSAVLPGAQVRFSSYDEPRYRSALQLRVGDVARRAACGGVLAEWSGRPNGVDAAHLRIFLEPWATVQSGQMIEFEPLPEGRGIISE
jgi:RNA polymerase sigma factor (sigma-70 family)